MTDRSLDAELRAALDWLEAHSSEKTRDGMARYGIVAQHALGVTVGDIRSLGKRIGENHALARELWRTGIYEARLLAAFVADPDALGSSEMDRWCRDFDNWAVCDTLCFHLFDRTPHAFGRIRAWATRREEFVKRAAFALLASVALHDRRTSDEPFAACLPLIEAAADDERNFVKKGVSWALRGVGARSRALHAACVELAERLAAAGPAERWVGKDALRDLTRAKVRAGLAVREARRATANAPKRGSAKSTPARAPAAPKRAAGERVVSARAAPARKVKKKAKKAGKAPARRRSRAG
ncbi:MAG TPA: DNA alkylation repair protein [Polyangiaceae bacterium]|nr:DNA alkylation repair protein [Polyangiaceae bacterium]